MKHLLYILVGLLEIAMLIAFCAVVIWLIAGAAEQQVIATSILATLGAVIWVGVSYSLGKDWMN